MKEYRVAYEVATRGGRGVDWHEDHERTIYDDWPHAGAAAARCIVQRNWFRNVRIEEREVGPWVLAQEVAG